MSSMNMIWVVLILFVQFLVGLIFEVLTERSSGSPTEPMGHYEIYAIYLEDMYGDPDDRPINTDR